MKHKSLRIQLPLSYAGIALLAALVLGAVLLVTLRSYYQSQERTYLFRNGLAMSHAVAQMVESGLSGETLEAQIKNLSLLTLARIRVLDNNDELLVDSGIPDSIKVTSISGAGGFSQVIVGAPQGMNTVPASGEDVSAGGVLFINGNFPSPYTQSFNVQQSKGEMAYPVPNTTYMAGEPHDVVGFVAPLGQSLYGYNLASPIVEIGRSDRDAILPLVNSTGAKIGSLQLSDGPAYGAEIVNSVAGAWAIAGLLAVILAAGVGILVSRRMAAPVLALTAVTSRMAEGDLSARASVSAPEELSALGHSFNEMAERIAEMISTLRNFVSDAAHELHTPITALRTDLEMATETPTAELAARALTQANRLQELVESLLDLSRLEAEIRREHASIDLTSLLQEVAEIYASRAEQAGLEFDLEIPTTTAAISGNELQLRSAIGNLLENAVKFTSEGGRIQLGLAQDQDHWRIWVEDTGIGIPEDEASYVFNRFHRARNVSEYAGNGLGLAIVKAIVDLHQGRIMLEKLSPGTRFSLFFLSQTVDE